MSGAGREDGVEPAVLYAMVPGFYAAVERARLAQPDTRPILVGGDPRKRGKVQSAAPAARERGVVEGMPMLEALERCPEARRIPTDMPHYRAVSSALRASLRREIEALEPDGLGAAFLDAGRSNRMLGDLTGALVARIDAELGLELTVGVGPTKGVAQLAARSVGGGEVRVVPQADVADFLAPLEVRELPGVGPRTASALADLGALTVGDLRKLSAEQLESALGNHGLEILAHAQAADRSRVRSQPHPTSVSRERLVDASGDGADTPVHALRELARALDGVLVRHDLHARRVALRVRFAAGGERTRSKTVVAGLRSAEEIGHEVQALLERCEVAGGPIRGLRITLAGLSPAGTQDRQLDLFN